MLGENIRKLRNTIGLTQVELAYRLGVTKQCVSNWENGNISPSVEMTLKISEVFSVSTDVLLGLDDRQYIEVTGLTDEEIAHIQCIINDIRK